MATEIRSETIEVNGERTLLVSVKNGAQAIGVCSMGASVSNGTVSSTEVKLFYMGNDPVINMLCPSHSNKRSDKTMSLSMSWQGTDKEIYSTLSACLDRLNRGDSLETGLRDTMAMLEDGVYAVYLSEYYPTDGSGMFFWGAYNLPHEVRASAEYNHTIGEVKTYKPCFLLPGCPLDIFNARSKTTADEAVKSRSVQGIVYHLSGLHSVLLEGHHSAVSCVEKGIPFNCAVIERVSEPYVSARTAPRPPQPEGGEGEAPPAPAPAQLDGITGYRSASVQIPLEQFPKDMLRVIIEGRSGAKPPHFSTLMKRSGAARKKAVTNSVLPYAVIEKAEQLPDCEMMESVFAVDSLSDAQLASLLAGDVEYNGSVIISPNFYSSVVTACNYLQFYDREKFIDFAVAILKNPELAATHEYIARRASALTSEKKLYKFFKEIADKGDPTYEKILPTAIKYVRDFKK